MDQLHAELQLRKMQDDIKKHSGKKRISLECQYMENVTKFLDMSKKPRPVVAGPSFKVLKKNCEQMGTKGNNLRRFVTIEHTKPLTLISKPRPAEEDTASSDPESCGQCGSTRAAFDDKQCAEICLDCGNTVFKPCGNGTHAEALDQIFRGQNVWKSSKNHYSYKRSNHFSAWLARVQGKEKCTIPVEVLDTIKNTLTKQRLNYKDKDHLTPERIREILKSKGFPKFYANVHRIRYLLTGFRPPQLTETQEEDLITMFLDITDLYVKLQKKGQTQRSNMLSYGFILHKECELLGFEISKMRLLKHDERMRAQEDIWKQICELSVEEGLNIPFISERTGSGSGGGGRRCPPDSTGR